MSDINFTCPHCQAELSVEARGIGREKPCPECGRTLVIPAPSEDVGQGGIAEAPPEPPAVAHDLAPPPRRSAAARAKGTAPARPAHPLGAEKDPPPSSPLEAGTQAGAVTASLVEAAQPKRILFWILGTGASLLACGLLVLIASYIFMSVSKVAGAVLLLVTALVFLGSVGVVAGGVAHFALPDEHKPDLLFPFLIQNGVALMGGPILFLLAWILISGIGNGLVGLINRGGGAGSFLGAILFLPQAAFNGALAVALLVWILIPCAIAVERIGPLTALLRLVRTICRRPAPLLAHTGITVFYSAVLTFFVTTLLVLMLIPTLRTNGPDIVGQVMSKGLGDLWTFVPEPSSPTGKSMAPLGESWWNGPATSLPESRPGADGGQRGDNLRYLCLGLLLTFGHAIPIVFWITSFTHYQLGVSGIPRTQNGPDLPDGRTPDE